MYIVPDLQVKKELQDEDAHVARLSMVNISHKYNVKIIPIHNITGIFYEP